jgi:diadenosine tetraphosphate (Ap4A) HIT family hydrolase
LYAFFNLHFVVKIVSSCGKGNNCNPIQDKNMAFTIDNRVSSTCFELGDWALSRVLLKNNAEFPWLILVPRIENITEIAQLSQQSRYVLMDEINQLSSIVSTYFKPDKLNIGTLGNIVSQLHIHVVGRFTTDSLWPHGIWQEGQPNIVYSQEKLQSLMEDLRDQIKNGNRPRH